MEPIVQVFKIENGFLVELTRPAGSIRSVSYAADATGIAELIIAAAAKEKLGIGTQQEMFTAQEMGETRRKK
jgi:hypothetical protein